jgi:hypothetical protein
MIDGEGERGDTRYRVLGLPEKGCFPEARGAARPASGWRESNPRSQLGRLELYH